MTPKGKKIDLDAPQHSIKELCEMAMKPITEETGLPIDFFLENDRDKIEETLKSRGYSSKPLIREYRSTGYPIGNSYIKRKDVEERYKKVKKFLESVE